MVRAGKPSPDMLITQALALSEALALAKLGTLEGQDSGRLPVQPTCPGLGAVAWL